MDEIKEHDILDRLPRNSKINSIERQEGYFVKDILNYTDKNGKKEKVEETVKHNKNPNKVKYYKITFGKNIIEVFGYKNALGRMMSTINHKKETLCEISDDDVKELLKLYNSLANKKGIIGENSRKALINRLNKKQKYDECKTSINEKGDII